MSTLSNYSPGVISFTFNNSTGLLERDDKPKYINDKIVRKSKKIAKHFAGINGIYSCIDDYGVLQITNIGTGYNSNGDITDDIPDDDSDFDEQEKADIAKYISDFEKAVAESASNIEDHSNSSEVSSFTQSVVDSPIVKEVSLSFIKDDSYTDDDNNHYSIVSKTKTAPFSSNGYRSVNSSTWENDNFLYVSTIYKNGENFEAYTNRSGDTVDNLKQVGFTVYEVPLPGYTDNYSNDSKHDWVVSNNKSKMKSLETDISNGLSKINKSNRKIETNCCVLACCEPDKYILIN